MGNCLKNSHRECGGGHVGDAVHCAAKKSAVLVEEEEEEEEEEELHGKSEKAAAPVTEVKIRIPRKQLEELLRRLDGKDGGGAIAELLCMTSSSNFRHREQAGQWRPSLQSILE